MNKTKENRKFKINNILLSAFPDNDSVVEFVKAENEKYAAEADKVLFKEYKDILAGRRYSLEDLKVPNLVSALMHINNNEPELAFGELAQLLKKTPDDVDLIKQTVSTLLNLKAYNIILKFFLPKLLPLTDVDSTVLELVANTYFSVPEYYSEAIPLYEKLVEKYPDSNKDYNYRLAFMYERVYQDKKINLQIKYAKEALNERCNKNLIYTFLAKLYYRNGDKNLCRQYLDMIMKNKPTAENVVSYSRFLMKEGKLTEGYDLYRCRFDTGNVAYPDLLIPEKRWDGKQDLSGKTVIIHYEQGFGDSVMFSRYIPEISKRAGKVIFVVQKNLIPIFKSSGFDKYCEILSHEADVNPTIELSDTNRSVMYSGGQGMGKIPHDYHIPLMDTPYLTKESPQKMTQASGCLSADKETVKEFKEKYISKNKKIKIGLAYHGTKESILTYRDISVKKFLPILKMDGVECYSFQSDKYAKELEELDKDIKIIDLGKVFKNFEDTACAMNCMDVIISTDNVVMNLAGALGIKTYGIFNVYTESRWYKTEGEDIGWYKSVRPFRAKTFNDWDNVISDIKEALIKDFGL